MRHLGPVVTLVALLSFGAGAGTARATSLTFAGTAVGCFNCDSNSLTAAPTTVGGLTFDGGSLTVNPDGTVDLGTFDLTLSTYNYSSTHTSFLLGVTFTDPAALDGAYTAEVEGTINRRQNGAVNIQFDPTFQTFSFSTASGSGSFDFGMFAPTLQLQPNDTSVALLGLIRNLQFTPNVTDPIVPDPVVTGTQDPTTPVPEPASMVLFGGGFGAAMLRRRSRKA